MCSHCVLINCVFVAKWHSIVCILYTPNLNSIQPNPTQRPQLLVFPPFVCVICKRAQKGGRHREKGKPRKEAVATTKRQAQNARTRSAKRKNGNTPAQSPPLPATTHRSFRCFCCCCSCIYAAGYSCECRQCACVSVSTPAAEATTIAKTTTAAKLKQK